MWLAPFFRGSQLSQRHVDDILMQIQGDLGRFQDSRALALCLAHRQGVGSNNVNYEQADQYYIGEEDGAWPDEAWSDDANVWYEDYYDYYGGDEYYDAESFGFDDGYYDEERQDETNADQANAAASADNSGTTSEAHKQPSYYKRSLGIGCTVCGSKWHEASSCPMSHVQCQLRQRKRQGKR